jgi:hypothetical protein
MRGGARVTMTVVNVNAFPATHKAATRVCAPIPIPQATTRPDRDASPPLPPGAIYSCCDLLSLGAGGIQNVIVTEDWR